MRREDRHSDRKGSHVDVSQLHGPSPELCAALSNVKLQLTTRCFLTGRGRAPGTPAFAAPGLCTWLDVGDTPPLLLNVVEAGPCAVGCARELSSNSRFTPRGTGVGVLMRGGGAGGCVGTDVVAGVEGKGVPAERGTVEP